MFEVTAHCGGLEYSSIALPLMTVLKIGRLSRLTATWSEDSIRPDTVKLGTTFVVLAALFSVDMVGLLLVFALIFRGLLVYKIELSVAVCFA